MADRVKMSRSDRAKQFAPFDALKGLHEAIKLKEFEHEMIAKNEMSEDEIKIISNEISQIEKGDKIITSGIGGVFPVGLPVGEVASVEKNIVKIKPANNLSRMEYVMIVDYKLPDPADELYGDVSK